MSVAPAPVGGRGIERPGSGPALLAGAALAIVVALAIAGAVLGAGMLTRDELPEATTTPVAGGPGPWGMSQDIPVSFGVVAVEHAERIAGVTQRAVASGAHNASVIPAGKEVVQTSVTLTNLLDRPVAYGPGQFRLLSGEGRKPVEMLGASISRSTLQPDAAIDGTLRFVRPEGKGELWLEFRDPAQKKPVLIELGRVTRGKAGNGLQSRTPVPAQPSQGGDGHAHHDGHGGSR